MEYSELLEAAKSNPDVADFKELRLEWLKSSGYVHTRGKSIAEALLERGFVEKDMQKMLKGATELLEINYLNISAHMAVRHAYEKLGEEQRAEYHRKFEKGLLESILQSGDGLSYETAFVVVDVEEEHSLLSAFGFEEVLQELCKHEGCYYDILECVNRETGKTIKMYFDVSNFFPSGGWYGRFLREEDST